MRRQHQPLIAAILITALTLSAIPGQARATGAYTPGAIYHAGDQVCHAGDLFRAKWWASPLDHPLDADRVSHSWQTPWERVQPAAPECGGQGPGNPTPVFGGAAVPAADRSGSTAAI
jgi:hypothetical protein